MSRNGIWICLCAGPVCVRAHLCWTLRTFRNTALFSRYVCSTSGSLFEVYIIKCSYVDTRLHYITASSQHCLPSAHAGHTHTHARSRARTNIHTRTHTYTRARAHTHTHTYTHTHTHTVKINLAWTLTQIAVWRRTLGAQSLFDWTGCCNNTSLFIYVFPGDTKFEVWLAIHGFAQCILLRRTKINMLCE